MEYAKDEMYIVKYANKEDKIKKHSNMNKFVFLLVTLGIVFSITNFVLIFNFFEILTRM